MGLGANIPRVSQFVRDSFLGVSTSLLSAHAGEIGAKWSLFSGPDTMRLGASGDIYNSNGAGALGSEMYASGIPRSPNYSLTAQYEMVSAMIGVIDGVGLQARKSPTANTRLLAWWRNDLTRWELYETINGVDTQVVTSVTNPLTTVFWPICTLVVNGSQVRFIVAGTVVASLTTTILTAGRAAFRFFNFDTASGPNSKLHLGRFTASYAINL